MFCASYSQMLIFDVLFTPNFYRYSMDSYERGSTDTYHLLTVNYASLIVRSNSSTGDEEPLVIDTIDRRWRKVLVRLNLA